jgi:hypothetical protein
MEPVSKSRQRRGVVHPLVYGSLLLVLSGCMDADCPTVSCSLDVPGSIPGMGMSHFPQLLRYMIGDIDPEREGSMAHFLKASRILTL